MVVFLQSLSKDKDVIQIHTHHSFHNEVVEDIVHYGLECSRTIGKAKEHDQQLKQPLIGLESCFLFVLFLDPHIVVALADIQLGEVPCTLEVVDKFGDEGK